MSSFPKALTTRYFQLINNRQSTEAQRTLQRIKTQIQETKWNHGYCKALQGMLLAQKTNGNQHTFLQNLNAADKAALQQHKNEFQKHVTDRFQEDFDRGFFSAWDDYTRLLINIINETKPRTDTEGQTSIIHYAKTTQKAK